jgi:hypothetical protein
MFRANPSQHITELVVAASRYGFDMDKDWGVFQKENTAD